MKIKLFDPEAEGKARVLFLISAFSAKPDAEGIVGWAKLFRLDFLVRYPDVMISVLKNRKISQRRLSAVDISGDIESRMIMYRWGPWDPMHYQYTASLYAGGLIDATREHRGMVFNATSLGNEITQSLARHDDWYVLNHRAQLARDYLDLSARRLTELIIEANPNVAQVKMREEI